MKKSNQDESNDVWKFAQILFVIVYIITSSNRKDKYILLAAGCKENGISTIYNREKFIKLTFLF